MCVCVVCVCVCVLGVSVGMDGRTVGRSVGRRVFIDRYMEGRTDVRIDMYTGMDMDRRAISRLCTL